MAVFRRHPQVSLLSASIEAIASLAVLELLIEPLRLLSLRAGLLVGGALRCLVALSLEHRWLERLAATP